jgi:hypothetical protein
MPRIRKRFPDGRYLKAMSDFNNISPIHRAVNEELEMFLDRVRSRVKDIRGQVDEGQDMGTEADVLHALSQRFGEPIAKSCVTFIRGSSGWNGFQRDNFNAKKETLEQNLDNNGVSYAQCSNAIDERPTMGQIIQALSADWRALSQEERDKYPPQGRNEKRKMDDDDFILEDHETYENQRAKKWKCMTRIVRI